jgi:hypothetical protein
MNIITRLIALLFCAIMMFVSQFAVMMYGWGLEPKSWLWIIGGMLMTIGFMTVISALSKE